MIKIIIKIEDSNLESLKIKVYLKVDTEIHLIKDCRTIDSAIQKKQELITAIPFAVIEVL